LSASPRSDLALLLLLPHPPFTAVYVAALRSGWLEPSFLPPLIAAAAPVASGVLTAVRLARGGARRRSVLLLALAVIETVWALAVLAIVGFAIAGRAG
jgi:hypothetical protein